MIVKTITIGKRVTVNLGNYNSIQVHHELTADLEEGDDYDEAVAGLNVLVDEYIDKELDKQGD